ncbi:MAG: hypothetical protein ACR2J8_09655 [Thermomicrobiales bacterium]
MGLDGHALKLLVRNRAEFGPLGRTLTLGRQELHVWEQYVPEELTRIEPGAPGTRMEPKSSGPLYLIVRTTVGDSVFRRESVQQSDYIHHWSLAGMDGT